MDYLTTQETAEKWEITSRMVASNCKKGRIPGAVKKGKTWLIPSDAKPPVDERMKKKVVAIEEDDELQGDFDKINKYDKDNEPIRYQSNELYRYMGFTRAALRYYEEIGLINPKRKPESKYREFDMYDISQLMSIDFYRKRGFAPLEIRSVMEKNNHVELDEIFQQKELEIKDTIARNEHMLKKLKATRSFQKKYQEQNDNYSIEYFQLYEVDNVITSVSAFAQYREQVLKYLDFEREDILSNMVRTITFDESGFKGSQMCITRKSNQLEKEEGKRYLESGMCLHRIIHADHNDDSIMESMFTSSHQWAQEHNISFKGAAYIFTPFTMLQEQSVHHCYEIWMPIK